MARAVRIGRAREAARQLDALLDEYESFDGGRCTHVSPVPTVSARPERVALVARRRPPTAGRPRSSPTRSGSRRRAAGRSIARSATVTATTSATAPPIAEIGVGRDSRVPGCRCWFRAREPVDESLAGRQQSVGASVADASGLDHWWLPSPSDGRPRMQCPPRTYPDVTTAVAATSAAAVMAGGDRRGRSVRCP